ncbi:hypothetical protein BaRGS_00025588, partial [Batillaria attramentaria]
MAKLGATYQSKTEVLHVEIPVYLTPPQSSERKITNANFSNTSADLWEQTFPRMINAKSELAEMYKCSGNSLNKSKVLVCTKKLYKRTRQALKRLVQSKRLFA